MTTTNSPVIRALQTRLLQRVGNLPAAHVQNKLMATTDRNLALSLLGCGDELEQAVFSRIAKRKADRVRSELAIMEHNRVAGTYSHDALAALLAALEANAKADGRPSYWRPRRSEERTGR